MKAKKAKRGRPPLPPAEKRKYIQLTLPQSTIDAARKIGNDNVSAGVEKAVAAMPLP